MGLTALTIGLLGVGTPIGAVGQTSATKTTGSQPIDSSAVAQTVDRFYAALVDGDSAAVARLLAPDAVILEGGGRETRTEYLGQHFHSDHAFLSALNRETTSRQIRGMDDVAWVTSTRRLYGTFKDQTYDLRSAGLIVLRRNGDDWRIQAVHWSSRSRE